MKKTLLILSLFALSLNANSQVFGTGDIQLNGSFSVKVKIDGTTNKTTLEMVAPSTVWFSVGFGGTNMSSGADVFRSDGSTITDAKTSSRVLPPADGQQDWSIESNDVSNGVRTMIVTRDNDTGDSDDFVFDANAGSLTLIWALGSSSTYAYHGGARGATSVTVLNTKEFNNLEFDMYPNPTAESLNIQLSSGAEKAIVKFYDYTGKLALTKTVEDSNNKINVNSLSKGIYLVKVLSDDKIGTQRFIKN